MSSDKDVLIIVNPVAGHQRGLRTSAAVARLLRADGRRVEVAETTAAGDASRIVREACSRNGGLPKLIVACGGDGCVQEVAGALASVREAEEGDGPVMGLAPAGRCNDFARAMGISANPISITETLQGGQPVDVDLGRCNGRTFCTVATVGVDAEVARYVDSMRMPLRGTPAYLYGAMRVLLRYRAQPLRIEGDFGTIEKRFLIVSCANTCSYGGAIRIAPRARPTDGLLDLCLVEAVSKLRLFSLLPRVLLGRHESAPEVQLISTGRMVIDSSAPRPIWADGEPLGTTPATIDVIPKAVSVMLPIEPPFPRR